MKVQQHQTGEERDEGGVEGGIQASNRYHQVLTISTE